MTGYLLLLLLLPAAQKQTNTHFYHSEESKASRDIIWDIWCDVAHWNQWDTGLADAKMDTPFSLNKEGLIISHNGRKSKFTVIEFHELSSYTIRTKLPLGILDVRRSMVPSGNGSWIITHDVCIHGASKWFFGVLLGKKFRRLLPDVVRNVKRIAEEYDD